MRRAIRRGQSIADYLTIAIPSNVTIHAIDSPKSSPDSPKTPSPTTTSFTDTTTKTKTDSPSPTSTTFPPSSITSSTSSATTATTSLPAVTTSSSSISLILNHSGLSTTSSLLPTSTLSTTSATTTKTSPSTTAVALNPAIPGSTTVVTSWTTLWVSASKSRTATVAHDAAAATTSTSVAAAAESMSTTDNGLGPMQYVSNEHLHLSAGGVAGIAVGSSAGTIILAVLLFILYRKWNKRRNEEDGDDNADSPAGGVKEYLSRRFTHKSDDRIMNELMTAAYSAENGGGGQQEYSGYGANNEKQGMNRREEDEMPILPRGPAPVAKPKFKRTPRVSKWLGRQNDEEMLNPMEARASFVSNATGLRTLDLRSMSGWGSDDGMSEYSGYTIPPRPAQQQQQRSQQPAPRRPTTQSSDGMLRDPGTTRNTLDRQFDDVQELVVKMGESKPVEQFPSPEELNLPAPPVRPPSIAARTEVTGRSSGTWNTWGVMQHRDQPKGWKDKLGM